MASDFTPYDTARLERRLDALDTAIAGWMDRWGCVRSGTRSASSSSGSAH